MQIVEEHVVDLAKIPGERLEAMVFSNRVETDVGGKRDRHSADDEQGRPPTRPRTCAFDPASRAERQQARPARRGRIRFEVQTPERLGGCDHDADQRGQRQWVGRPIGSEERRHRDHERERRGEAHRLVKRRGPAVLGGHQGRRERDTAPPASPSPSVRSSTCRRAPPSALSVTNDETQSPATNCEPQADRRADRDQRADGDRHPGDPIVGRSSETPPDLAYRRHDWVPPLYRARQKRERRGSTGGSTGGP